MVAIKYSPNSEYSRSYVLQLTHVHVGALCTVTLHSTSRVAFDKSRRIQRVTLTLDSGIAEMLAIFGKQHRGKRVRAKSIEPESAAIEIDGGIVALQESAAESLTVEMADELAIIHDVTPDIAQDNPVGHSTSPLLQDDGLHLKVAHQLTYTGEQNEQSIWLDSDEDEDEDIGSNSDADSDSEVEDSFGGLDLSDPFLSSWDQLGEDFEQAALMSVDDLNGRDIDILRQYSLKLKSHMTDATYRDLPYAFPASNVPSLEAAQSRIAFLAGFKPEIYDCCTNSCCCYIGPHEKRNRCPYCDTPRFYEDGRARKHFVYIPLIPRLRAFASSKSMATQMRYRAHEHKHVPGKISDVFDGKRYRRISRKNVIVDGKVLPFTHFGDARDVALGLSTDGFAPWRKRSKTCWPLIIFNYNLPPEIRFHIENIISLGVIPGPKKPVDMDSFAWPLVQELLQLAVGVRAFDILSGSLFALRAFLILAFGDIPAVSLLARMKGHNGYSPCRLCKILGLRTPNSRATTHYVPLDRSKHPNALANTSAVKVYDPHNLPLRTHNEIIQMAHDVQSADTEAQAERLSKEYGIKGLSIFSRLSSISMADSFPYDFMHLIWENLIKNLVLLWTGQFKGLDEGTGSYQLNRTIWDAIGTATAASSSTIPGCFGARPPNVAADKLASTADTWSFWTLYLGPVLLQRKFHHVKYYEHFIGLVQLLHLCLQFEISSSELDTIREGFIKWVKKYEDLYYQKDPSRISTCPVTIHALLHIADCIKICGGIRFFEAAGPRSDGREKIELRVATYETCTLLPPRRLSSPTQALCRKILNSLATRYDAVNNIRALERSIRQGSIEQWGKVRINDGDTIWAAHFAGTGDDRRDATYVRYEVLVDKHANKPRLAPLFEPKTFYGRLQHIFVVRLPTTADVGITRPETIVLAAITPCKIEGHHDVLDIHYYSTESTTLSVVDLQCVQCVVGRIRDAQRWAIIDRNHHYARPSRINWLPCNSGSSSKSLHAPRHPTTVYAHAHPLGRSISSPVLPSWPAAGSRIYRHASVSSNRSLQLDMPFDDRPTESNDSLTLLHLKPLSPIIEQAQLVGDRRDSSLRTVGTGPAPTLPPLDLQPPFVASHHAGPQLFSTVYEDAASERTGSFVTARTDATSDHSPEPNSDPDPDPFGCTVGWPSRVEVGVIALDMHGHLAAAGSTGGVLGKSVGHIGDTCVIGSGLYADTVSALVCSGAGDIILSNAVASKIAADAHHEPLSALVASNLIFPSREPL
ncbi:hypothetical protein EW146_g7643 [Bondarzewia mesenterica]|uniref:Transposase family Tnp2 protein n=1 Tax=Bondarzewia mesenterica TaxID=1095465 RepID=A0A4S4LKD1_9AGAM|nr:hypothetical protein EW146_g7643 [Bondarzewia mesenterica]